MELTRDSARTELLKFREKQGITQEKLSEKSGVAKGTIIAIENGRKTPQAVTIYKLNQYLANFN